MVRVGYVVRLCKALENAYYQIISNGTKPEWILIK